MANENLSFDRARYNGVVTVVADQIKQISNLEKKYKALISEFLRDLNELGNNEHWIVPPLNNLIKKWEEKLK